MDVLTRLNLLREYFRRTHGVGHTKAMLNGAKCSEGVLVLVAIQGQSRTIRRVAPDAEVLTFFTLERL